MLPTYATFNSVDVGDQIWYPARYSGFSLVKVGNGSLLPISHVGHTTLSTPHKPLCLRNVLHVPQLCHNLLSNRNLCRDNKCRVVFDSNFVRL